MTGGSEEPENPHDKKCPHCGLYYADKGPSFYLHKSACDGQEDSSDETSETDTSPEAETSTSQTSTENSERPFDSPPVEDRGGSSNTDTSDTGEIELPCGHESIDPSEIPADRLPVNVVCETCGDKWRLTE